MGTTLTCGAAALPHRVPSHARPHSRRTDLSPARKMVLHLRWVFLILEQKVTIVWFICVKNRIGGEEVCCIGYAESHTVGLSETIQ